MKKMQEKAEKLRIQNILNIAVSFSAIGRVFEEGSTEKIRAKLGTCIDDFLNLSAEEEYQEKHKEYCEWFTENIKTAERKKIGRVIKNSQYASWGQATRVIDNVLKVCIYYCNLPSAEVSSKILPWLNGAVDTSILEDFRNRSNSPIISQTSTIEDIDEVKYNELQKMIRTDIEKSFAGEILPVQYDDIKWKELNRQTD